ISRVNAFFKEFTSDTYKLCSSPRLRLHAIALHESAGPIHNFFTLWYKEKINTALHQPHHEN
ncbi:hypothetical protein, partial [Janthinobacterium sp. CG_23.3]|uniref:hypothetical protein n=1 Tax=Janthinobacterium sp. CG_23.3 TaxID=3349634 RepID=UPI0038D47709